MGVDKTVGSGIKACLQTTQLRLHLVICREACCPCVTSQDSAR